MREQGKALEGDLGLWQLGVPQECLAPTLGAAEGWAGLRVQGPLTELALQYKVWGCHGVHGTQSPGAPEDSP